MLQKALYDYLRKECKTILKAYAQLQQLSGDPDAIHTTRLGVKKLRAFFLLTKQLPGFSFRYKKYLHALKRLQSIGGVSRDMQLMEENLGSFEKKIAWRFSFAHLLLHTKHTTSNELLAAVLKHTSFNKVDTLPEDFQHQLTAADMPAFTTLLSYVTDQCRSISLPASNAHPTKWHALRKQVKTLYYQLTILETIVPSPGIIKKLMLHTHKAGDLLGQWHDTSELLKFVKDCIAQLKKEKITLPVNATALINFLQRAIKEQLALGAGEIRKILAVNS